MKKPAYHVPRVLKAKISVYLNDPRGFNDDNCGNNWI